MSSVTFSSVLITLQPTATSVVLNPIRTYTFDPSGRLVSLYVDGMYFARSLNGDLKEKSWSGAVDEFDRHIRVLPETEKDALLKGVYLDLESATQRIQKRSVSFEFRSDIRNETEAPKDVCVRTLHKLMSRLTELPQEEKNYQKNYLPISILPPDHYFTVVFQITEGCPWNKCAFCDFYENRRFRIRTLEEIRTHIDRVGEFFREGIRLRNSAFLADANAFVMKKSDLVIVLGWIQRLFESAWTGENLTRGQLENRFHVSSFADIPAILGKSDRDLSDLFQAGLKKIYIGLESGSDKIREKINKPGRSREVVRSVQRLKNVGFDVGLIVMLGLGGLEESAEHVEGTVQTLRNLSLSSSDIIFFSPFYPDRESPYHQVAMNNSWTPLNKDSMRTQVRTMKAQLAGWWSSAPRQGIYDIREFVY